MDVWGLLFALFVRTFLFQPFTASSGAMEPTLAPGDIFVGAKYAYGYSRFSASLLPADRLPLGRLFALTPNRGDVVIFKLPRDNQTDYVKRVIGLPGDKVQMIAGRLYINGAVVEREAIAPYTIEGQLGKPVQAAHYIETLPGGASYEIVEIQGGKGFLADTPLFETPPEHYFVMGDNRDNSTDSRVPPEKGGVGFVPRDNLEGRAARVIFSAASRGRPFFAAIR